MLSPRHPRRRLFAGALTIAAAITLTPAPAHADPPPLVSAYAVAAVGAGGGEQFVLVRGTDNRLYNRSTAPGARWIQAPLPAVLTSGPAATRAYGYYSLAVRGSAHQALGGVGWHPLPADRDHWSGWFDDGGVLSAAPALAFYEAGNFLVTFARGTDGAIYYQTNQRTERPWYRLDGLFTSAPTATYRPADRTIILTARGTDGYLYRAIGFGTTPFHFSAFARVSTTPVYSAGSVAANSARYYYRGSDNALWYLDTAASGAPGRRIGGTITSTPSALQVGGGENVDVFARGSAGQVLRYSVATATWTDLGGVAA